MNSELNENEKKVRSSVLVLFREINVATVDAIREKVQKIVDLFEFTDVNMEKVVRNIEVCINVSMGGVSGVIGDDADHIEWLQLKRPNIEWKYWDRYKHWLQFTNGLPQAVVDDLDDTTDLVLARLEDPARAGMWDRRGMVVGHVQSGKTGNYTGLICKAVDAGYRLIVVLAGSDNGLRSQTQLRIDEGFLGFTMGYGTGSQKGSNVGVGLLPEFAAGGFNPISLTTAEEVGDFKTSKANQIGIKPGGEQPLILVVKKNVTILKNLIDWAGAVTGAEREGIHKIANTPIFVIDDECDFGSVNTKNTVYEFERAGGVHGEPTKINGLIRKLLNMFDQSAYAGYTATPFANIFIYHEPGKERPEFGEDLFPRSFIICLARSSEYVGAEQVFGLRESVVQGIEAAQGLPILRPFSDLENWIYPKHDKSWKPPVGPLPNSLYEALLAFVLVCAVRHARGQENAHNSMLIHLSRFVEVQKELFHAIEDNLNAIRRAVRSHTENDPRSVVAELKHLWESDFVITTKKFNDPDLEVLSWHQIEAHLRIAIEKIKVKAIYGKSDDALEYYENRKTGTSIIAIGGQMLSRGLTLEGLSVSYFQRTTKMYDTLMQMGRWFGYRPGYVDLCRLYSTDELIRWYGDIAMATEELYDQFEEMRITGATPKEFGLKVAKSPDSLLVTARVKMRNTTTLKLSYEGSNPSYRAIKASLVAQSIQATQKLVTWASSLAAQEKQNHTYVFNNLTADGVLRFLNEFPSYPKPIAGDPRRLAEYIKACNSINELKIWSIGIVSLQKPKPEESRIAIGDLEINLVKRYGQTVDGDWSIKTLWDPADEALGLTAEQILLAKDAAHPKEPLGKQYRAVRPATHGLLAIYLIDAKDAKDAENASSEFADFKYFPAFAISFPGSTNAPDIDYIVRNDYAEDEELEEVEL
jgi:hypothetical protein